MAADGIGAGVSAHSCEYGGGVVFVPCFGSPRPESFSRYLASALNASCFTKDSSSPNRSTVIVGSHHRNLGHVYLRVHCARWGRAHLPCA